MTPASTLEDAVERLTPKAGDIRELGVERLALFGSVSRGEPRPDSDADALGRPVELVTIESLSPILGPKILAEARDVIRAA